MNEHLTTALAAEHRRDLLAEARSNGLARQAREGRPSWWQQLTARVARHTRKRSDIARISAHPAH